MAGIRELPTDIALVTLWQELVFTWARLQARPATRHLAAAFEELIARTEKTELGQRGHWRAEYLADAAVEVGDEDLDDVTDDVISEVRHADRKAPDSPREKHYLGALTLGAVLRLGLDSQIKRLTPWLKALGTEPEDALRALGKRLAKVIAAGEAALQGRDDAAGARAVHRARQITSLVADANAARRHAFGALVQIAAANKRPKDWPESFFRHATAKKGTPAPDAPPVPDAPKG